MNKICNQLKLLRQRGIIKYYHYILLKIAKYFKYGFTFRSIQKKVVEIVYVVHTKDASTIQKSIESLNYIKNVIIRNIYVITNDLEVIKNTIKNPKIILVNEIDVVRFNLKRYPYPLDPVNYGNRSGWLYQQLLKLGWAHHAKCENYIVVDSDTYFIQPISFFSKSEKFIFFGTEEWWPPYYQAFYLLFGERSKARWSRVAHMMVFNKKKVLAMQRELEQLHGSTWHEVISRTRNLNSHACFSEYETYANWMLLRYPNECEVRPSYNTNSSNPQLKKNPSKFNSVSNHSYLEE